MIDKTILHYRIVEKLGEGGMGVVYKTEDTKLERVVALKFLSSHAIAGEEEKKRFKREAKAAAALNHPNICHIYAIDEADDQLFIAMEFIEGKSLAEMVGANGGSPLQIPDAINYATQIASGLQAAHEKGITHRDIKSANVMVTDKGVVKIMDFGLAKLGNRSMMTKAGTTLGTAAYMSPEQARGEIVDQRTDIWSLGVVLYEMISGRLPFRGEYEQAMVYSILNEEPEPLTALRSNVPIALDGIIAKALAKDPATRYQHVDEVPADLKALDSASKRQSRISRMTQPLAHSQPSKGSNLPWIIIAGLMTVLAAAGFWYGWRTTTSDRPLAGVKRVNLTLTLPEGFTMGLFVLSPDGMMLAFTGYSGGRSQLFLRHLDNDEITPLAGTEYAERPFFSPDSKWLGFWSGGRLRKVSVDGGAPVDICQSDVGGISWGDNDEIVFSLGASLLRVPAQGGLPEPLPAHEPESETGADFRSPQILPGGRHVLFTSTPRTGSIAEGSIVLQSIESGERHMLIHGGTDPHYLPTGHIVYVRSGNLMAVPFDLASLRITGPGITLAEQVSTTTQGLANFTVSMDGSMIYASGNRQTSDLVWVDRQGGFTPLSAPAHDYWDPRLAPDGRRLAVNTLDNGWEIWLLELARGTLTRLSANPDEDETSSWSPDGRWIAFISGQPRTLFRKRVDSNDAAELLWRSNHHLHVECWSPDGRSIVVTDSDPTTLDDLWLISLEDEISAQPLLQTQYHEFGGRISPDGRWLAYTSRESGRDEVYVQAFPLLGNKTQVSINGGSQPVWSRNGRELFYRGDGQLMVVPVTPGDAFVITSPKALFADKYLTPGAKHTTYDVASDGKRFLMIQGDSQGRTNLNVVFNWFEEVKRLAPAGEQK